MSAPAPYQNLTTEPAEAVRDERICQVIDVEGAKAVVDDAGTQLTALIPSSVLGVALGRTVVVKSSGNSRTVVRVVTAIEKGNYLGSAPVKRIIPVAPSTATPGTIDPFTISSVRTVSAPSSTGLSRRTIVSFDDQSDWNRTTDDLYRALVATVTSLTSANAELRTALTEVRAVLADLRTVTNAQTGRVAGVTNTVEELRQVVATQIGDLAKFGIIEKS